MSDPYTPFNRDALLAMTALLQQLAARGKVRFTKTGLPEPIVGDMRCVFNDMTVTIECAFAAEGTFLIAPSTGYARVYYSVSDGSIQFVVRSQLRQPIRMKFEPAD